MILSFRHKGLRQFFETGSMHGIQAAHATRLSHVLLLLSHASTPSDVDTTGLRLHRLKGKLAGFWSVTISGNWRVIFRFAGRDVELVDYLDYH